MIQFLGLRALIDAIRGRYWMLARACGAARAGDKSAKLGLVDSV